MIYEMSIEGKLPTQQSDKQYVRGEILLCCYLILPVTKMNPSSSILAMSPVWT